MNGFIYRARIALISIGKILPFVICGIVLISYVESAYALITEDYAIYDDELLLRKPISWFIGSYFEYNITHLIVLIVLSVAIETCIFNKLACLYLGINLYEKYWFTNHEYDNDVYYVIIALNIIASAYLVYKGIIILISVK